ncbi:zinc-binding protein A33-like, partial [Hypanus sabinus]|uniref:zinc-binding protein A33-like n=1 Tax=Hypanus sabinus TaxID=79690 RepID=UPI0028C3802A
MQGPVPQQLRDRRLTDPQAVPRTRRETDSECCWKIINSGKDARNLLACHHIEMSGEQRFPTSGPRLLVSVFGTKWKERKRHCKEHEEELKLFCETDRTPICVICRDAQEHREHRFMPIKEAVKIYTDQIKSSLDSLTKKKSDFQEKEQQQKEKISGVREQSHSLQSHVTSQFAELRQIITEKEQSLLRHLRKEEKRILNPMEKNLREIQENIRFIQEEITKLKEQMDQKDSVIFLKAEARRNRRINDDIQELSVIDETQPVEKFDHLYLLKTVLRETLDAINR